MRCTLPLLLIAAVTACSAEDRREPPPPSKPASPSLAHATQADLAKEIDEAGRLGTWDDVRYRWQGQVLRWTVYWRSALCHSEKACNVAAFPIMQAAKHGWMPRLELARDQLAALQAACRAAEPCAVTIEGTLDKLELSPDNPTSVHFANVRVLRRS